MGSTNEVLEVSSLERQLLAGSASNEECEDDEIVLYNASFEEMENSYIKYQTTRWILYSLFLILAWGIGFFMLLYLPVLQYVMRKDFHQRRLYITRNAIVYKVRRPVLFPCFGVLKKIKHVLLPSVADVVVEQGYLQSFFGVYSIRIENAGVRKPSTDDVQIQGLADPWTFRKASTSRSLKSVSVITLEDEILQKLQEIESSVKLTHVICPHSNLATYACPYPNLLMLKACETRPIPCVEESVFESDQQSTDRSNWRFKAVLSSAPDHPANFPLSPAIAS
ncbi:hypothetical protein AXF42_Ash017465 [Apostasia shenzhenica]|uniref:DUF7642 domain-containing protein n=1 Tax=Apostasia shenzhenica TaxID=1088818 RepID=A0A2H9ZZ60_9ASPA|nr:hypothetical protein AXF42_Ash017465 [Apostasia shenzhenica]